VIGYELDNPGVRVRVLIGSRIFSPSHRQNWAQPATYPINIGVCFPQGVKRQDDEVDHSPETSAVVNKTSSSHPLVHMSSWCNA
jgi:hypothetical protein